MAATTLRHGRSFLPLTAKSRPSTRPRPRVSCFSPHCSTKWKRDYTSVMIVPTGVGAAIGGYAGDALPVARALSSVVDCLITHPNVLNAAMLYWPMPNVLYVEGYALDRFAEDLWTLLPVHQNKVGLVLDCGIEEELRIRHLQVADATRASLGLPIVECIVTDTPLEVEKWVDPESGQSTGRIKHPGSLLRAVHTLVSRSQVNAVAVVGRFPDDDVDDVDEYRLGKGIDVLAGVEAIISHLIVKEFMIPCAHAPAMLPFPLTQSLCPKSAAEEIGYTFLPCVLAGLSKAPQYLVKHSLSTAEGCISASDVDSIILPVDACGGDGALAFSRRKANKPLIVTVEENETVLDGTPDKFGIETVKVANYWEAIGVIAAHKAGIDPESLRRDRIGNIRHASVVPWEVTLLEALSPPNLIKLLGYCREDKELLLVYEFMQKGTLENTLFEENLAIGPLSWNVRLKIAIQAAKGLAFLHLKHIICGDFTVSNILLDGDYNAKILDFGLASLEYRGGFSNVQTVTHGYAPPEYMNGHLSVKSDGYGFGVVLLQMITGLRAVDPKRPFGQKNIVERLKPSLSNIGQLKSIVDARMEGQYSSDGMWRASQITLKCLNKSPGLRPHMVEVVQLLEQIECMEKPK